MREGAFDFLIKPFHPAAFTEVVRAALAHSQGGVAARSGPADSSPAGGGAVLLGNSAPLKRLLATVEQVGPTDATVLILGETGSGKEVIARLLHASSPRASERLVVVNCAAIPETLIESELFGHVKGAFTNADETRLGLLREADRGSLLLDEVGELALPMQARLLRVVHRDLEAMVREGRFRQDLFFRLNVVPVEVPPLRERLDDVPVLAAHFLAQAARRMGRAISLSEKTVGLLQLYSWPGNVRELANLIERMAILDRDGVIDDDDMPAALGSEATATVTGAFQDLGDRGVDLPTSVARFERALIGAAMRRTANNKSKAAMLLGIGRTTLIDKLRKLGM
jgi:two-component system response regulator HydG